MGRVRLFFFFTNYFCQRQAFNLILPILVCLAQSSRLAIDNEVSIRRRDTRLEVGKDSPVKLVKTEAETALRDTDQLVAEISR